MVAGFPWEYEEYSNLGAAGETQVLERIKYQTFVCV